MERDLQRFIQDELAVDPERPVELDDELLIDGLIDSLGVMRLVTHIEERTGLSVPPEDVTIENFRTVRILTGYVLRRTADAQP